MAPTTVTMTFSLTASECYSGSSFAVSLMTLTDCTNNRPRGSYGSQYSPGDVRNEIAAVRT